jgi:hypothetical protein
VISFTLGILYALPTVGILYFANWALDGITGSGVRTRNRSESVVSLILSTMWFGIAVALCWVCTWVLVRSLGELDWMFEFRIDDRLFWVGVVAGIVGLGGGLHVRYRVAKRDV